MNVTDDFSVFPVKGKLPYPGVAWRSESRPRGEWGDLWPADATGYGIDTGKSNLVVIDEDQPGAVVKWLGYEPSTFTVDSGRGAHFYFEAPTSGTAIGCSASKVAPGVDIKAAGGYAIGPGSKHPDGSLYTVSNSSFPAALEHRIRYDLGWSSTEATEDEPSIQEYIEHQVEQGAWLPEYKRLRFEEAAKEKVAEFHTQGALPPDIATLAELLQRDDPPGDRIAGLFPWDASVTIIAKNKTGKTTLTGNLARCLITGEDFLGRFGVIPIQEDAYVCILNYEMSPSTFGQWADDMSIPHDRLLVVNLRGRTNPLASKAGREQLARMLQPYKIETLIVDPFGQAFPGDQDKSSAVSPWLTSLNQFAREQVGATDLVLVVHTGWDDKHSRGSSALEDWPDAKWYLTKDDSDTRFFKAYGRDVDFPEDSLSYDPETRLLSLTGEGSRQEQAFDYNKVLIGGDILKFLAEHPGESGKTIKEMVSGSNNVVHSALKDLVKSGKVIQAKSTRRGGGLAYTVADPAAELQPSNTN